MKGIRWCIFQKNSNIQSIGFLPFFAKRRKMVEKMMHQKGNRIHRRCKIVKCGQSYSNGHLPYHCSFYYLQRGIACTVSMPKKVSANVLKKRGIAGDGSVVLPQVLDLRGPKNEEYRFVYDASMHDKIYMQSQTRKKRRMTLSRDCTWPGIFGSVCSKAQSKAPRLSN